MTDDGQDREIPLERIERLIGQRKAEPEFLVTRTRDVRLDGGRFGGEDYREWLDGWEELHDREKFAELAGLDWRGVEPDDRRRLLGREVNLDRISPATLGLFLDRDGDRPRDSPSPLPCPSQIIDAFANATDAAEAMKALLKGQPVHVEDERSGQLFPSHTPSRGR